MRWYARAVIRSVALPALVATLVAAGCAPREGTTAPGARPRIATATRAEGPRPALTRHATLRYDLGGRPFPLPVVHATISGHPTILLVDTGANVHVVAGWLARKLGLSMKKLGGQGSDHVGRAITTWRVESPELALEEWGPVSASSLIVTEIPEAIEKMGIGGILSPQKLGDEGDAVVVDLYRGELRAAWWDEASRELASRGAPLVVGPEDNACEEPDGSGSALSYVVPATIEGEKLALLVDTGAQRSDIFASSASGQRLSPRSVVDKEPIYTAAGKVSARRLRDAKVQAGGFSVVADVGLVQGKADSACPRDGVLAMDLLRACTLLFGRARVAGSCLRIDGAR